MSKQVTAIAVFTGTKITGSVKFTEETNSGPIRIDVNLVGLKKTHYMVSTFTNLVT
jgi:hypothetical protein